MCNTHEVTSKLNTHTQSHTADSGSCKDEVHTPSHGHKSHLTMAILGHWHKAPFGPVGTITLILEVRANARAECVHLQNNVYTCKVFASIIESKTLTWQMNNSAVVETTNVSNCKQHVSHIRVLYFNRQTRYAVLAAEREQRLTITYSPTLGQLYRSVHLYRVTNISARYVLIT